MPERRPAELTAPCTKLKETVLGGTDRNLNPSFPQICSLFQSATNMSLSSCLMIQATMLWKQLQMLVVMLSICMIWNCLLNIGPNQLIIHIMYNMCNKILTKLLLKIIVSSLGWNKTVFFLLLSLLVSLLVCFLKCSLFDFTLYVYLSPKGSFLRNFLKILFEPDFNIFLLY